ncbi:MAG: chemotaxis protein CheW [Myxococcales bacterium]|nr:chemotaxis protein CheW [Myxococcales bacterium]MCB9580487.1 chemotaxis protein CheW [Polyangiaceae bacterium]
MTAQPEPAESLDRCISVRVAGALYGLRVEEVQEVIGTRPITRVFHAPAALAGVTSLRGDVLPVLDLGVLLGGDGGLASTPEVRIVVVREKAGARRRAGLRVDALGGLRDLPPEGLAPVPTTAAERVRDLAIGVIASPPPCTVLGVSALFDAPELAALAGGEADAP